jgi:hypothetical protein
MCNGAAAAAVAACSRYRVPPPELMPCWSASLIQGMDIIAYGDSITEAFRGSGYGHQTPKYESNKATWRRRMGKRR